MESQNLKDLAARAKAFAAKHRKFTPLAPAKAVKPESDR